MKTLLIANRGEIAIRIMKTAQAMGYRTVAIHSAEDHNALHIQYADLAVQVEGASPVDAYLNINGIIDHCRRLGVDYVHPGYGFLSENPAFASALEAANIPLVGPSAHSIELMGNKRAAKDLAMAHQVPCIPGKNLSDSDDVDHAKTLADRMGYPVLIKAAAGGGGRGMRVCEQEGDFANAFQSARKEALSAFGNGELILEKWIESGYHVEIQVLFDSHGHGIYLGERDCSLQRRHQKIIEESPSVQVNPPLRQAMGEAAVRLGLACKYQGAGTVEFLVDDGQFYFLEMNTRLQVEHPVTELCTGLDLVEWQLKIAAGTPLTLTQDDIQPKGHAIEARVCAEDPAAQFSPQTGTVARFDAPDGSHTIRVDHCLNKGTTISPFYDSLVGKWIAWGETRDAAIAQLQSMLQRTTLLGVKTNLDYLNQCLSEPDFINGKAHIHWIDQHPPVAQPLDDHRLMLSAMAWYLLPHPRQGIASIVPLGLPYPWSIPLQNHERTDTITIFNDYHEQTLTAHLNSQTLVAQYPTMDSEHFCLTINGTRLRLAWSIDEAGLWLHDQEKTWITTNERHKPPAQADEASSGIYRAHIPGRVLSVDVKEGERVSVGQALLSLESMKMEHTFLSQVSGTVEQITVITNAQVNKNDLLVHIHCDE